MIIVILLQRARGGGLVGALGAGGSETALGALGNKEMVKVTTWLAIAFFLLAILLDFNPPERRGVEVGNFTATDGSVARFDEDGETINPEEAPMEVEGEVPVDEDLLGGALGSENAPAEADPDTASQ
jgi:protein translocase SecG subunit